MRLSQSSPNTSDAEGNVAAMVAQTDLLIQEALEELNREIGRRRKPALTEADLMKKNIDKWRKGGR